MAKFKVGDKVRLKKGLEVGKFYGDVPFLRGVKENAEANGGIHIVRMIRKATETRVTNRYILDTDIPYYYSEEMLELVEGKTHDETA